MRSWEESNDQQTPNVNGDIVPTPQTTAPINPVTDPTVPTVPQTNPGLIVPPDPTAPQEDDSSPGFFGTIADMGKGMAAGAYDAVGETVNLLSDGANLVMDDEHQVGDILPGSEEYINVETGAGHLTKTITQFALGFIGAGKFLKAAKLLQGAGKAAIAGRGLAQGALADFTVFDAHEERLSNLIESSPTFANPITEFLAADENDSAAMGRFKNVIEGMALGVVGEALITMVRGVKATRAARTVTEAEDAVIHASDELETLAAKAGQTPEELSHSIEATINGDTKVLTDTVVDAGGKVELNVHGAEHLPEDANKLVDSLKNTVDEATPVKGGVASKGDLLTGQELQHVWDDAAAKGYSLKDVVEGRYAIGNGKRIGFDSLEEASFNAEYYLRALDKTLKGKGVETHAYILRTQPELSEQLGAAGVLDMASKDRASVQDMARRLVMYESHAQYYSSKFGEVLQEIKLHGETPERLARREEYSKAYQELSLAVADIKTGTARSLATGRITPIIPDDVFSRVFELTQGDTAKTLRIVNDLRRTPLQRIGNVFTEVVINGLLSSPITQAVNITSNMLKTLIMPAEKMLGGAIMGDKQLISEGVETYTGLFKYLGESWKVCKTALQTGDNILDAGHKIMDTGRHQPALSTYAKIRDSIMARKAARGENLAEGLSTFEELQARTASFIGLPSRALGGMDEMFKQLNYRANMYSKLSVEGVAKFGNDVARIAEYVENGMKDAFDSMGRGVDKDALLLAQESTWTQNLRDGAHFNGGIGQGLSNMVNAIPPLRLVVPFIRTPTNLIRDFIAHTPGLNLVTKRYRDAIKAGGERQAMAYGQMATGSMLLTSAVGLAASGKMTGGYPKDPATRQAWIDSGIQPYSFRVGDKYVSFARVDPFSTLFGIVADYAEYTRNWADSSKGNFASGMVLALGQNIMNKSYLTGVMDLMNALTDDTVDSTGMQRFLQKAMVMFVPYSSGLRFTRRLTDDSLREVRGSLDALMDAIPGTSYLLPEKRSWITGEAVPQNLFWSTHKNDVVANELAKLGDNLSVGAPGRKVKGVELDADQYARLCELQGTIKIGGLTQHERLERLMKSTSYDLGRRRIPDMPGDLESPRSQMVEEVITEYRKASQKALLREDEKLRSATDVELQTRIAARRGNAPRVQELLTMPKE